MAISTILLSLFSSQLFLFGIIILTIWDLVWKGLGLWRSARNGHTIWFLVILFISSLGIIPIIYLLLHPEKKKRRS